MDQGTGSREQGSGRDSRTAELCHSGAFCCGEGKCYAAQMKQQKKGDGNGDLHGARKYRRTTVRERVATLMTYCGGATAAGCGAVSAAQNESAVRTPVLDVVAPQIGQAAQGAGLSISDIGIYVGIAVGVIGLLIQGYCALSRRKEEKELHRIMKKRLSDPRTPLSINDKAA